MHSIETTEQKLSTSLKLYIFLKQVFESFEKCHYRDSVLNAFFCYLDLNPSGVGGTRYLASHCSVDLGLNSMPFGDSCASHRIHRISHEEDEFPICSHCNACTCITAMNTCSCPQQVVLQPTEALNGYCTKKSYCDHSCVYLYDCWCNLICQCDHRPAYSLRLNDVHQAFHERLFGKDSQPTGTQPCSSSFPTHLGMRSALYHSTHCERATQQRRPRHSTTPVITELLIEETSDDEAIEIHTPARYRNLKGNFENYERKRRHRNQVRPYKLAHKESFERRLHLKEHMIGQRAMSKRPTDNNEYLDGRSDNSEISTQGYSPPSNEISDDDTLLIESVF